MPIVTLQIFASDIERITAALEEKINQARGFFQDTPVILDFTHLAEPTIDIEPLLLAVRATGLLPIAAHSDDASLAQGLTAAGLSVLKARNKTKAPTDKVADPVESPEPIVSTLHDTVLRSGQQLYAKEGDLILTAQTSAGSEVIADGNIHVYGALRGRAFCGANGDTQARIFCQKLEADLVAVAGNYKLIDDIPENLHGQAVQVWLDGETLKIEKLTA